MPEAMARRKGVQGWNSAAPERSAGAKRVVSFAQRNFEQSLEYPKRKILQQTYPFQIASYFTL